MPTPEQIRSARERAGLTQPRAAELMPVHPITVAKWETGARAMSERDWRLWKHVLGVERIPFRAASPRQ
jgi:DNA-binding transcriptional regulator YiaG